MGYVFDFCYMKVDIGAIITRIVDGCFLDDIRIVQHFTYNFFTFLESGWGMAKF